MAATSTASSSRPARETARGMSTQVTQRLGGVWQGLKPAGANRRVPRLDEVVWLIPGHCDPTVNLHNHLVAVTGGLEHGRVEKIIRVDARGALT